MNNHPVKVAIVLLNWNGRKLLEKFLPVLYQNTYESDIAIYVADNNSDDDSVQWVKDNYPQTEIIALHKNYGFAQGYNLALARINARYYVLLNTDIEVPPKWLAPLTELLDNNPDIVAAQPKIKSFKHPQYFEYAGAAGGFIDRFGYPFCRGRILGTLEKDNGQYNTISPIFWASGATMIIRSSIFHEAGGFDPDFFAHQEEIDLCWRIKNRGYHIYYQPNSVVYHVGGGTLANESPHKLFLNYRNNLFLIYKNIPAHKFPQILFIRLVLDFSSAMIYLLRLKTPQFKSVIKAYIAVIKQLNSLRAKRKKLQSKRIEDEHAEIFSKSIVFYYFLKNKKFFSKLKHMD